MRFHIQPQNILINANITSYSPPPRDQVAYERWSLVFFSRPSNVVELRALTDQSPTIAEAVANSPDPTKFNTGQTARAWFARRIKNQRIKNRTVRGLLLNVLVWALLAEPLFYRVLRRGVPVEAQSIVNSKRQS